MLISLIYLTAEMARQPPTLIFFIFPTNLILNSIFGFNGYHSHKRPKLRCTHLSAVLFDLPVPDKVNLIFCHKQKTTKTFCIYSDQDRIQE